MKACASGAGSCTHGTDRHPGGTGKGWWNGGRCSVGTWLGRNTLWGWLRCYRLYVNSHYEGLVSL